VAELDSRTFGSAEAQTGPSRGDTNHNTSFFSHSLRKHDFAIVVMGGYYLGVEGS